MQREVSDCIIYLVGAVHDCVGCVCVSDEVHSILLTVQRSLRFALLAVVQHDGVVVAAGDDGLAVGAEVEAVDLVRVLAEHLGHAEAPQDVVRQLHAAGPGRAALRGGRAEGGRAGGAAERAGKGKAGPGEGRRGEVRQSKAGPSGSARLSEGQREAVG